MPRTAPAIIFPDPNQAALDELPIPEPGDGDVLVRVEYSSLSVGTERWCLTGRLQNPGEPPLAFPHVPGYQASGVVLEAGRAVKGLKPGDRVFSRNCRAPAGWQGSWWGGHVGLHVAEEGAVLKLPDGVGLPEASGLLLAQVGYNGASRPPVAAGLVAAVIGDGLVGQYAGQVLRWRGARVLLSGLSPLRLQLAARHSADEVFDASRGDFGSFVRGLFPKGVQVAVETASSQRMVRQAIDLLAYGVAPASEAMRWRLGLLGLHTIGDIARLPLGAFQAQFGPEGKRCWELARGVDNEPLAPRVKEETVVRRLQLGARAVTLEAILVGLERLVYAAYTSPDRRGRWVRKTVVRAALDDGGSWELAVPFREALADPRDAWFAVKSVVERHPPERPVEELEVELVGLSRESGKQAGMLEGKGKLWRQVEEAARQLRAQGGRAPIGKVVEVEPWSRIPERRAFLIEYDP